MKRNQGLLIVGMLAAALTDGCGPDVPGIGLPVVGGDVPASDLNTQPDRGGKACSVELDPPELCARNCGTSPVGIRNCVNGTWGACECLGVTPDASTDVPADLAPPDLPVVDAMPTPDVLADVTPTCPVCAFNETCAPSTGRCVSNCAPCATGQQCVLFASGEWTCRALPPPPDAGPTFVCALNETRECVCIGGARSAQTCLPDRSGFGPCQCLDASVSTDVVTPPDALPADAMPTPDASADASPMCLIGMMDCDGNATNGCETDTRITTNHCGACGRTCSAPIGTNSIPVCIASRCGLQCANGFANCNATIGDGCETDTRTTLANCGACGRTCSAPANAIAVCASGACGYTCMSGYADCDRDASNGCEINLNSTESACGRCGNACQRDQVCANGACQFLCTPGDGGVSLTSCPGGATCINLQTDLANCGACANVCEANVHAHATCMGGVCGNTCSTGFGDCDNVVRNGCERELVSDPLHCGACRNACPVPANASAVCVSSRCGFACNTGWGDCNGYTFDGCETNLTNSTTSCGACGRSCPSGQSCTNGACTGPITPVCPPGRIDCGSYTPVCIDPATDRFNCGDCGFYSGFFVCTPSEVCQSGACRLCPSGQVACGNTCTDLRTNTANCGACGRACASSQTCVAGACVTPCPTGTAACGGACINTTSDINNCGVCGVVCPARANATGVACVSSACTYGACNTNFGDCNGAATDGCETVTINNNAHCGRCGNACPSGTVCSGTTCVTVMADAATDVFTDAAVVDTGVPDGGLFPGEHMIFLQNGSGVADADAGVTVGSVANNCRGAMVIQTYNNLRGGTLSSPPGGALNQPITGGRANVKLFCNGIPIDLLMAYRAGARNLRDLLGSDSVLRVDGRTVDNRLAPIVRDIYAGGYAIVVAITEPDGSIKPGSMITLAPMSNGNPFTPQAAFGANTFACIIPSRIQREEELLAA